MVLGKRVLLKPNLRACKIINAFQWCLFAPCFFLFILFFFNSGTPPETELTAIRPEWNISVEQLHPISEMDYDNDDESYSKFIRELQYAPTIPEHSLTAVLPVTLESLDNLRANLKLLYWPSPHLKSIMLVCSSAAISQARSLVRDLVSTGTDKYSSRGLPEISLRPWAAYINMESGVMRAANEASTDWVLLLDEMGLMGLNSCTRNMLLHPLSVSFPIGPRGQPTTTTDSEVMDGAHPAAYMRPPFVMPASFQPDRSTAFGQDPWSTFNGFMTTTRNESSLRGVILHTEQEGPSLCSSGEFRLNVRKTCERGDEGITHIQPSDGSFAILLVDENDINHISGLLCKLFDQGRYMRIFLTGKLGSKAFRSEKRTMYLDKCVLHYYLLIQDEETLLEKHYEDLDILRRLYGGSNGPDITIAVEDGSIPLLSSIANSKSRVISIPRSDLPYCDWLASLSLEELKNWNIPRIDISIITKDRPKSLERLMQSLSRALYFGDTLNLRINVEQDSDEETMRIVHETKWLHGSSFVHHRVVHGGLLQAVVESWYPQSDHNYGLLLEDDVELSPLFYAWIKMNILRYRYGSSSNRSPLLFGVSLYQQKNIELPMTGRQPFNARELFSKEHLPHPDSPYLSPIPCSWGAVYFPEQWREFHEYLTLRLSQKLLTIENNVVPNVRSNHWRKSWKKYFIELVYLRGYVMLYPNYEDFISLSTNHLEFGSHVKVRTKEKQELFLLPLMQLPDYSKATKKTAVDLLDLPYGVLPEWSDLPVLNLTGELSKLETLLDTGYMRHRELTGCEPQRSVYGVQDLICKSTHST